MTNEEIIKEILRHAVIKYDSNIEEDITFVLDCFKEHGMNALYSKSKGYDSGYYALGYNYIISDSGNHVWNNSQNIFQVMKRYEGKRYLLTFNSVRALYNIKDKEDLADMIRFIKYSKRSLEYEIELSSQ